MKRYLDVDHLLVFLLLAVTINQMGHYLAQFAPPGWAWVGYAQAIAIDAAIWRSAYWFRCYSGRKQRMYSLLGLLVFAVVSAWYNGSYYRTGPVPLGVVTPWVMGAVLPLGVALLSYLSGQKDESRFGVRLQQSPPVTDSVTERDERKPAPVVRFTCPQCRREWASQNALNAHQRSHNGHGERIAV